MKEAANRGGLFAVIRFWCALVGFFGTPGLQLGHGIPYAIAETQAA